MSTKTTFLLPDFDKNIPNKVNEHVEVKSQHVLSIKDAPSWNSAIATSGFSSKTDGVYVFATKNDNIGFGSLIVGFTDVKTYDSKKNGFPGHEFTGTSLSCLLGNRYRGSVPYLSPDITQKANEIISILIVSNNGSKKEIQWIVDGIEGPFHEVTKGFEDGDEIFPCITFGEKNQQVELIPFRQVKFRSPNIEKFLKEYSSSASIANQSKPAVANNNNNQLQPSSSALIQLQQELDKERQRANLLEMQLQDERKNSTAKDQQLQQKDQQLQQKDTEIERLRQLLNPCPFVKDKLYQIDFASNGITPPADPNAFGTLLKLPSSNSVLFQHVKNDLWKKLGTSWPSPKGVYDFTLESIEVIHSDVATLEARMRRLQQLRSQNGNFFNPPTGAFTAEQLQTLIALRDQFLPRSSSADPKSPNLINVFHGTKVDRLQSVVNGLVAVRSTDAGYFGSGVYTTTSIEYAAKYAKGEFDFKFGPYPPRASDGCIPVVWCVAAVGVCYPLTREVDYSKKRVHDGTGVSDFFGTPLTPGYDCHCVAVNESAGFQAVPRKDMQYMEIVFDQEFQVLPIAVLWVKSL